MCFADTAKQSQEKSKDSTKTTVAGQGVWTGQLRRPKMVFLGNSDLFLDGICAHSTDDNSWNLK